MPGKQHSASGMISRMRQAHSAHTMPGKQHPLSGIIWHSRPAHSIPYQTPNNPCQALHPPCQA
eukprot:405940-Pelagomonas_calceolata.AAC.1